MNDNAQLSTELQVAISAARLAGVEVMRLREEGVRYGRKDGWELVSEADVRAAVIVHEQISSAFPDDGWLSEEHVDTTRRLDCDRVWVVDPIDGTREYLQGIPEFAISIGLVQAGVPVLGVVYNPAKDEMFSGAVDGAAESGSRMTPASVRVLVGRGEHRNDEVLPLPGGARAIPIGSVAYRLALLSAGTGDAVMTGYGRSEWDVAAGVALCLGQGMRATDILGRPLPFNQPEPAVRGLLVARPGVHEFLLRHFQQLT